MRTAKQLVLGIEGGGTKTEWVLLEDGVLVAQGGLPAANFRLIARPNLEAMLQLLPRGATHVGIFLAGCATEQDRESLRELAAKVWPAAIIHAGSDRESGFTTAFGDGDGIAVLAGTGSAVTGRRAGRLEKAGGWGQLLGDHGSGYDVAMQGLRMALRRYDLEREVTPLATGILRALSLNALPQLVDWVSTADKMAVARLAPVIFQAARLGDTAMEAIIRTGARQLAEHTAAVAARLEFIEPEVKLTGGIFTNHPEYAELFKRELAPLLPRATVSLCAESGALGAAVLAGMDELPRDERGRRQFEPGLTARLAATPTEQPDSRSARLSEMSTAEIITLFVEDQHTVGRAIVHCAAELEKAVDLIATALRDGGHLFYVGAGTSGRLGVLDASEVPPTFGAPPELVQGIIAGGQAALSRAVEGAEDERETGALTIRQRGVTGRDVVCGITASGGAPFVHGALQAAQAVGAKTILLTCHPGWSGEGDYDVSIHLPTGSELLAGSTPTQSGHRDQDGAEYSDDDHLHPPRPRGREPDD
ncbi:MAG: N-acetylmuramic acid 6-phosphate etherase [Chthoniobacteraceae bacterium]